LDEARACRRTTKPRLLPPGEAGAGRLRDVAAASRPSQQLRPRRGSVTRDIKSVQLSNGLKPLYVEGDRDEFLPRSDQEALV